jgi:hypothetical protein
MTDREVLRAFALGMAAGAVRQARGPVRNEGAAPGSSSRAVRLPTRAEWMLGWARVACGWLVFAAERT